MTNRTTDPRARQLAEAVHRLAREKATKLPAWQDLPISEREKATTEARLWLRAAVEAGIAPPAVAPDAPSVPPGAPLRPSQPSSVSESAQSPTGAATGHLGDLPSTEDLAAADNPTPLRWGLNDVLWSDDGSVIVLLSGPDREAYWLELDPERAAVLREDLAGPDGAPSPERDTLIAELLPAWEAMYEPGNVSTYLIGYANSEAGAKGAAEAWMRSQAEVTGRLEWERWSDATTLPDGYDALFELIERHDDGIDTGPGIAVRCRIQPTAIEEQQ